MYAGLFAAAAAAALFVNVPQSRAEDGPWCSSVPTGDASESIRCDYVSYEECRQEVVINRGSCFRNPNFTETSSPPPRPPR